MNIDFYSEDDLQLRFADEETLRAQPQPLVNHYTSIESSSINFYDLFDVDESNNQSHLSESKFFDKKNPKLEKSSKHDVTIYLKESLGNLKTRRKTVHRNIPTHLMKNIENIVIPANNQELIQLFLHSEYFMWFIRLIAILNLIGIFLIDYSFRVSEDEEHPPKLTTLNIASLSLQLFANCVFTFEILLRLYQSSDNAKDPYLIINMIGTIAW